MPYGLCRTGHRIRDSLAIAFKSNSSAWTGVAYPLPEVLEFFVIWIENCFEEFLIPVRPADIFWRAAALTG